MNDKIVPIEEEITTSTPIQSKFPDSSAEIDIQQFQHPEPISYAQNQPIIRTNHRMVRSLLYMGQLLNPTQTPGNDFLVNSLETLTSLMDNVYLITKFGIGSNSKFLKKVGANASKVWFVTLLFTIRKILKNLLKLSNIKNQVWKEIKICEVEQYRNNLAKLILRKYQLKIEDIESEILSDSVELLGSLNDLLFVSIELFRLKVPRWIEKLIGFISAMMMIYRMSRRSN